MVGLPFVLVKLLSLLKHSVQSSIIVLPVSQGMVSAGFPIAGKVEQRRDVMMMIFTVVLIVVVIEVALYGICCFVCREKHVSEEIRDDQTKDNLGSLRSSSCWDYPPG